MGGLSSPGRMPVELIMPSGKSCTNHGLPALTDANPIALGAATEYQGILYLCGGYFIGNK